MSTMNDALDISAMIMDNIRYDKPSLLAASLVCRSWCTQSRRHLFRTVCVDFPAKTFTSFLLFITRDQANSSKNLPSVPQLIRNLRFCGPDLELAITYGQRSAATRPPIISISYLKSVLSILTELKRLTLDEIQLHVTSTSMPDIEPPIMDSRVAYELENLSIGSIWTTSSDYAELSDILSLFAHIDVLDIPGVVHSSPLPTRDDVLSDGPMPQYITPDLWSKSVDHHGKPLQDWLLPRLTSESINVRQLRVYQPCDYGHGAVHGFLEKGLQELLVTITGMFTRSDIPNLADAGAPFQSIDRHPGQTSVLALRSMLKAANVWGFAGSPTQAHPFTAMTADIVKKAPRTINTLVFVFAIKGPCSQGWLSSIRRLMIHAMEDVSAWMDDVLESCPHIKEVQFVWERTRDAVDASPFYAVCDGLSDFVRKELAELDAKGMLTIKEYLIDL